MTSSFVLFLLIGKILVFFGMKFAEDNGITKNDTFIGRLLRCDLCWGFWVYSLLSLLLGVTLFSEHIYVPLLSELWTGGLTSFAVQYMLEVPLWWVEFQLFKILKRHRNISMRYIWQMAIQF